MNKSTLSLLMIALCGAAPVHTQPAGVPASRPTSKPVPFQPGIEIDWGRREVRAKATVIMRKGLIELFACSPQQREHESIVRMEARPLHLYHALGMIGLTPGHPIRLNPDTQKEEMATGDPVEIEVRYEATGQVRQEPIERWMKLSGKGGRLEPLPWVFAGSSQVDGGGIAADGEGTVIALVDFGSSLIALPEHHTDQNDALWLVPATENIPPMETSCTLIIRAGPIRINLDAAGRLTIDGRKSNALELSRAVKTRVKTTPN